MRRSPRSSGRLLALEGGIRWAIAAALLACSREQSSRTDSAASTPPAVAAPTRTDSAPPAAVSATTPAASAASSCVSEGAWQACSVEKRLTDAGFVPINKGAAPTNVFSVPGTTYALGSAQVHVYVFKSAKEREAAVAGIDTTTVSRRGTTPSWPLPAWLITSSNLAAILVSDNGRLVERVQNAIRAGLPAASH